MLKNQTRLAAFCLITSLLVAGPALAHTVTAGIDLWHTAADGSSYIDFSNNPIPAGFFCPGSAAFSGIVPVKGKQFNANPALDNADTIIERLDDVDLAVGDSGVTRIVVRGLSLVSISPLAISGCGSYNVKATVDPDAQAETDMTIHHTRSDGGVFDAELLIDADVRFTHTTDGTVLYFTDQVNMTTESACWDHTPGQGGYSVAGPIDFDADCDGTREYTLENGTSNFFPGYCSGTPVQVNHTGPHPTEPPEQKCQKRDQDTTEYQANSRASQIQPAPKPCPVQVEPQQPAQTVN